MPTPTRKPLFPPGLTLISLFADPPSAERQTQGALMRPLARRLLDSHLDWIEEVESTLAPGRQRSTAN